MKKRLQIDSGILEFFILILLAMAMIFYLNGCTAEALKLAKDKASPENAGYLSHLPIPPDFAGEVAAVKAVVTTYYS